MTIATRKPNKSPRRVVRKTTTIRKSARPMLDSRQMLKRIDEMLGELEWMRRQLIPPQPTTVPGLTDMLFGAAGHGTWEEYDLDLDWKRFSEWNHR